MSSTNKFKEISRIRKQDAVVDGFLKELTPELAESTIARWFKISQKISGFLGKSHVSPLHLAALADILYTRRKEDLTLLKHSRAEKKGYSGADDFLEFLKEYTAGEIGLTGIRFDFKDLNDKHGARINNSDFKNRSARSITIPGVIILEGIMTTLIANQMLDKAAHYDVSFRNPVFKKNEYPDKKSEFIRRHNKTATEVLFGLVEKDAKLSIKEKKLLVMNVLVFIKFVEPYETYKRNAIAKKVKRVLAEKEYYLQRFSEFSRSF